jgi:uncharacterized protein (UPF0212 family)
MEAARIFKAAQEAEHAIESALCSAEQQELFDKEIKFVICNLCNLTPTQCISSLSKSNTLSASLI